MSTALTIPIPSPAQEMAVTHDSVRHFIWDRTLEDNPMELDLEFSDAEIGHARQFAAEMINSMPPFTVQIQPNQVPTNWAYPFRLAVTYHLFLAKIMALQRKDLDYTAGNMTVDINKRRIEYMSKWVKVFKDEAMQLIKELTYLSHLVRI